MNKYPDYIMRKLRQRRWLEPNDISSDEILNNFSPQQAFKEVLSWEGLINWDETIKEWINDIYSINIDDNLVQAAPDMYEALKELVASFNELYAEAMADNPDRMRIVDIATKTLRSDSLTKQALKKAEGRTD